MTPTSPETRTPPLSLARPLSAGSSFRPPSRGGFTGTKTSFEASLISMLRRQQDIFEEKIVAQLSQMRMQGDRLREASLARVEEKLGSLETSQARASRGLAELNGKFRGVSDEIQ